MSTLIAPFLRKLSGKGNDDKHIVSGSYNFSTDLPTNKNYNGFKFVGSEFVIDYASLPFAGAASLPPAKSILINTTFSTSVDFEDGPLLIFVPDTGVLYVLSPDTGNGGSGQYVVSVALSVPSNFPSKIYIGKGKDSAGNMNGTVTFSVFDWDFPGVNIQGSANI